MLGANRDQKLAAIITPPVKPSMASYILRRIVLKKNTKAAPSAVTDHVKVVAISAEYTGPMRIKYCSSSSTKQYSKDDLRCR